MLEMPLTHMSSERQIEQINDRLSGIEDTLKGFKIRQSASPASVPARTPSTSSAPSHSQIATPSAFEGASSFTSQAIQASRAAGRSFEKIWGSELWVELIDMVSYVSIYLYQMYFLEVLPPT